MATRTEAGRKVSVELLEVQHRRFTEACDAGLPIDAANMFSESGVDVGLLRRLVRDGCPPDLIARIIAPLP